MSSIVERDSVFLVVQRSKQSSPHAESAPPAAAHAPTRPSSTTQTAGAAGAAAVSRISGKAVVFTSNDYYQNWIGNMITKVMDFPLQHAEAGYFHSQGYEVVETSDLKVLRDALADPNVKAVAINSHGDGDGMMDEDNNYSVFTEAFAGKPGLAFTGNDGHDQQLHLDELIAAGCDTADDHGDGGLQKASGAKMFMGNEGHSDGYADVHFAIRLAVARLTGSSPAIDNKTIHYDANRFAEEHPNLPAWLKAILTH